MYTVVLLIAIYWLLLKKWSGTSLLALWPLPAEFSEFVAMVIILSVSIVQCDVLKGTVPHDEAMTLLWFSLTTGQLLRICPGCWCFVVRVCPNWRLFITQEWLQSCNSDVKVSEWKSVWIKFNSRHTIGWWGICMGEVCNHINHQN